MFDLFIQSLYTYYGLDWIAFVSGVTGFYLISEKKRIGFIFQALSLLCAIGCSLIAGQFGFVVSNFVTFGVVIYGYCNWQDDG